MNLTQNETQFVLWSALTLFGVLGFIGALAVRALIKMGNDLGEIKISLREVATKHDAIEKRVTRIENHVYDN